MDCEKSDEFSEIDHTDMDIDSEFSDDCGIDIKTNETKGLEKDDVELLNTRIIHDVTDEKVYYRMDKSSPVVESKGSKEIANDEVLNKGNLTKRSAKAGNTCVPYKYYRTIKQEQEKDIVKPKVNNENYKTAQHMSPEKAFANINDLFAVKKNDVNKQKKRKLEDVLSSDTLSTFSSEDSLSELIDSPVLENMESFLILDDLEEFGAVGGRDPVSERTNTNTTQNDVPKSTKENLSGILHRKSSVNRKPSSVQFDESVAIETFSQTEPASDCSPKAILAQGDGPDPNQTPARTFGPFAGPVSVARLNDLSERGVADSRDSERTTSCVRSANETPPCHSSEVSARQGSFQRKDSTPRMLSPTELLRQKQKVVADKIIHSLSLKGGDSKDSVGHSSHEHTVTKNDDFSKETGTEICERQGALEDNSHYSDSMFENRLGNDNNINQTAENGFSLVKVNSADFIDPKFLYNLPDMGNRFVDLREKWRKLDENTQENHKKPYKEQAPSYKSTSEWLESTKPRDSKGVENPEVSNHKNQNDQQHVSEEKHQDKKNSKDPVTKIATSVDIGVSSESIGMPNISKSQPGYWFFKDFDTSFSKIYDENGTREFTPYLYHQSDPEKISAHACDIQDKADEDGGKAKKIQERLSRKKRLDSLRNKRFQHNHLSLLWHGDSCTEHVIQEPDEICSDNREFKDRRPANEDQENSNVEEHRNNFDAGVDDLHCDAAQKAVDYMNSLLAEFLDMIAFKNERGMAITVNDYKELDLIQSTIKYIGNTLTALTETADSMASTNSQTDSLREGGSSQIHVDIHDRNMIMKHLDKLKMSLSNAEKNMRCWSDSVMNTNFVDTQKRDKLKVYETESASAKVSTDNDKRYLADDYGEMRRNFKTESIILDTPANLRQTGNTKLKEENREANKNEILQSNFEHLSQSHQKENESDSFLCVPCVDNESIGYLGDRSESESSIPVTKTYHQKTRLNDSDLQNLYSEPQSQSSRNEDKLKGHKDVGVTPVSSKGLASEQLQSGELEYISLPPSSPHRNSESLYYPHLREARDVRENSYRTHLYEDRKMYPDLSWSRVATENTLESDPIYPGYYLAHGRINSERQESSEPQLLGKYGNIASNIQLTSNNFYKAQSSSEFENDDEEDNGDRCYTRSNDVLKLTEGTYPNVIVSPRKIKLLTCVSVPDDLRGVHMDLGSTSLTVKRQDDYHPKQVRDSGQDLSKELTQEVILRFPC